MIPANVAVVLAGGRGSRMGADRNKVLLPLLDQPVITWSLRAFGAHPAIDRVLLVGSASDLFELAEIIETSQLGGIELIAGGKERADSERAALDYLRNQIDSETIELIAIHDGARPLVSAALISRAFQALNDRTVVGVVPALAAPALIAGRGHSFGPLPPGEVVRVQTPQVFRARPLLDAYDAAASTGFLGTDTSSYVERCGGSIKVVAGDQRNLKITFPADLVEAQRLAIDQR
ncbi:MAG: IspD/TarI family cytidylyltransferase [Antricoccus sp.]